tara:strand:+ start:222 stop:551 length:330 start_codon:yes stop_codon:yes gene_type:complete
MFTISTFIAILSIIVCVVLAVLLNRSINRVTYLETIFENMHGNLGTFTLFCETVLNKPIYANEPVLMNMLSQIKDLYSFLRTVEDFYTFDLELADDNLKLEKDSGEEAE